MNKEFLDRISLYFEDKADLYIKKLNEPCTQGFFLNSKKASKEDIFELINFDYKQSQLSKNCFYHFCDNIGKTKAYELGLIYPQEIAASLTSTVIDTNSIKTVVDMCAAPGGKTINVMNKLDDDVLFIANDFNHSRVAILSSNLERLGLDNVIITNKKCEELANQLENFADLVILDAPCSGEGMIRKYPEILDEYSVNNINSLAKLQSELLEDAYKILKEGGQLLYSTCTYAFEEDEEQVKQFLNKHIDMRIVNIKNQYESKLKGTSKLSPLQNTEGQFICLMKKDGTLKENKFKYLKETSDTIVNKFIKDNLNIDEYYLYKNNEHYYVSLIPLIDLKNNVMKYGTYIGDVINKRFEPSHNLYRSISLRNKFKYVYELSDNEYDKYIKGDVLKIDQNKNYYLVTYKGYSLGYGKCANGILKNKYPKGLRRQ